MSVEKGYKYTHDINCHVVAILILHNLNIADWFAMTISDLMSHLHDKPS